MKYAYAVIGSAFGDEGKGNITDILCAQNPSKTINVRFNGGSQALHTVVTPDGQRYAFRHFGAGTLAGTPTYLSKEFLANVITFDMELCDIKKKLGITPFVAVHPEARVTTLWDMNINKLVERLRGDKRHGSCGFGINETVHRSKYPEYGITVMDLLYRDRLFEKLKKIQDEYVPVRLEKKYNLRVKDIPQEYMDDFFNEKIIDMTMDMSGSFVQNVFISDDSVLNRYEIAVFEGAQGLLLDQSAERFWPNVTTSNTGIQNVVEIIKGMNPDIFLETYYVSRCYATRHGRGVFPTETEGKPYSKIVDETNVPNEFQESMRFGILDLDLICEAINKDLKYNTLRGKINVALTCCDQLDETVRYRYEGKDESVSKEQFLKTVRRILSCEISSLASVYTTQGIKRDELIRI